MVGTPFAPGGSGAPPPHRAARGPRTAREREDWQVERDPAQLEALRGPDGAPAAPLPDRRRPEATRLRVATWNLRECVPGEGDVDPEAELLTVLDGEHIDLIALQEVPFAGRSDVSPLLSSISTRTPLRHTAGYVLSRSSRSERGWSGLAVASRYPIDSFRAAVLPRPRCATGGVWDQDRGLVTVRSTVAGREVAMTSVHLFPFERLGRQAEEPEFADMWRWLAEQLEPEDEEIVLVAGDFNTPCRHLLLDRSRLPLHSALLGRPTRDGRAMDDVLYGKGATPSAVSVLPTRVGGALCLAELVLD